MKIVFFGTPEIALPSLESLAKANDIAILAVVTQPDKPAGRKQVMTPPPIKTLASEFNIPVLQPENKEELATLLKNFPADFFVVFAYGMIFSKEILSMAKYGAINIHTSLLPKYRGASPIQQALLNGDQETGVTIMKMSQKMDTGDIYSLKRLPIENTDNLGILTQKLGILSGSIIAHTLRDIAEGILKPIPQNDTKATYCKKITKDEGNIDWKKSAAEINNMIRAFTPWPSAFTFFQDKKLKILEAIISEKTSTPGKFHLNGKILEIGTAKGVLIPKKVQLEGKNVTSIEDFINGNQKTLSELK